MAVLADEAMDTTACLDQAEKHIARAVMELRAGVVEMRRAQLHNRAATSISERLRRFFFPPTTQMAV